LQELTKIGQLKTVAWSDESRFLLRHSDGRVRIRHKENENMDPSCLVTTVQAGGGGVMVWGMFSWHTLGPLVLIGHRLNGKAYLSIVSSCPGCASHKSPPTARCYPINMGQQHKSHGVTNHSIELTFFFV